MQRTHLKPIALGLLIVLHAAVALGSVVSLNPVRIHLSSAKRSEVLVVRNTGKTAARFQFTAHTWAETVDGQMKLAPTNDILVFPSLLEVKAGETRRVRLASTSPPGHEERSYRLIAAELPQSSAPGVVQVLTKLNVPVFVQAVRAPDKPTLTARMEKGQVVVSLENRGGSYFKAQSVRIVARSSAGAPVFQQTLAGWYVLAHGRRQYRIDTPAAKCADVASIAATVTTEQGKLNALAKVEPGVACRR
jgi:fimbrial chaperone protein